jgi:hypothetical protein
MDPVTIRHSRKWPLVVLSGAVVGLAVAAVVHGSGSPLIVFDLFSFVVCGVLAIWLLFDTRPQVVLDDRGIFDRRLRVGLIPWSSIQRAYAEPSGGLEMVWVEVRRDDMTGLRCDRVPLRVTGLDTTTAQLLSLIAKGSSARR